MTAVNIYQIIRRYVIISIQTGIAYNSGIILNHRIIPGSDYRLYLRRIFQPGNSADVIS